MHTESNETPTALTAHRRSVIKAAAWGVPAVVVATSAPAFASSTTGDQLPAGLTTTWRARAQVDAGNGPFMAVLNQAGDDEVRYRVTGADGKVVADGTYVTTATITLTWSFNSAVTPTILAGNGWTMSGSADPALSGTITFSQALYNGDSMALTSPQVTFVPVGAAPTSGGVSANTGGVNLGTVGSTANL
ncbi:hypothetical protein [Nocardioides yefusunii]|uniref:Htaa domain-containing protein n=1 Tax=Nocardioides yefusunii TaxID=2500546 RepID=A0ABW1QWK4_9ACTN|nr:hypothetical protein [Nocardioides yefusunii]